ncbi:MAG: hypothetical protein P4L40_12295 [Terracidiphilus sp.]|nr:hypothetical protein [Terracidiphilus sp.]
MHPAVPYPPPVRHRVCVCVCAWFAGHNSAARDCHSYWHASGTHTLFLT